MENRPEDELVFIHERTITNNEILEEIVKYKGEILYTTSFTIDPGKFLYLSHFRLENKTEICRTPLIEYTREHIKKHFSENRETIDKILNGMNIYGE